MPTVTNSVKSKRRPPPSVRMVHSWPDADKAALLEVTSEPYPPPEPQPTPEPYPYPAGHARPTPGERVYLSPVMGESSP